MFTSVFSFLVSAGGFTIVVLLSFFCSGGFTTVVLLSFFSAGGFVTVVSFCSQAANSAIPKSRQIYFFIPMNRITAPRVMPLSLPHAVNLNFIGRGDFSPRGTRMRSACPAIVLKRRALAPGLLQSQEPSRVRRWDSNPSLCCTARQAAPQLAEGSE